jgi:hypothetical protein
LRKEEFTKGYFSKVNYFVRHYLKQTAVSKGKNPDAVETASREIPREAVAAMLD